MEIVRKIIVGLTFHVTLLSILLDYAHVVRYIQVLTLSISQNLYLSFHLTYKSYLYISKVLTYSKLKSVITLISLLPM